MAARAGDPPGRWAALAAIGTGTLLAFAPWFSASAVGPLLAVEWRTEGLQLPLLTVAVPLEPEKVPRVPVVLETAPPVTFNTPVPA